MSGPAALWKAAAAAAATKGVLTGEWEACGVAIDSRAIAAGDLFVALKGPTFDGHAFAADALAKGAAAAIVSSVPAGLENDGRLLLVADTLRALEDLGRAARARTGARIAALTGSVGKTGTKNALAQVLSEQGATHGSVGSFNNHWGVPLSLARMPEATRFGVFEIGMNHAGEIEPLVGMVRPHVAIVINVEAVHLEFFSGVEAIADAKAEIFAGVEPGGAAVINGDNPHAARLRRAAATRGISEVIEFGSAPQARVRLGDHELGDDGSRVTAFVDGLKVDYRLAMPGRHWVMNSLAVLAAAAALGADVEAAAAALAGVTPPPGRGRRETIRRAGGAFELVDESYNASPPSMRAALQTLGRSTPGAGGRRVAVLGDMLELGDDAPALHAGLALDVVDAGVDVVFASGPNMARLWVALPENLRGAWCQNSDELAGCVSDAITAGDVVMVKGSHGSRMDLVVNALRALGGGEGGER